MLTTPENSIRKDTFLPSQLRMLQIILMWPIQCDGYRKRLVYVYFWFVAFCLSLVSVGLISKAVVTTDLVDRSEAIDIVTLTSTALFKMIYFSRHHKQLKALVDFADFEFLKKPYLDSSDLNMKHWMRFCGPFSLMHCSVAFLFISFWGICPILNVLFGIKPLSEMTLPMNVWYPFDFNTGNTFKVLYVVHYFGLISSTQVYMSCDGFFFSLIYLVNGQIKIIKANLKAIKNIVPKGNETVEEAKHNMLKRCIEHHNKIVSFLRGLDGEFRTMILADVLHAIISLSFAMLQTSGTSIVMVLANYINIFWESQETTSEKANLFYSTIFQQEAPFQSLVKELVGPKIHSANICKNLESKYLESIGILESIKMVLFLSYCFMHQYLNSLFGQSLINQQESLMTSVYNLDWIDEPLPFKKSLHIMMTGTVNPVKFSAWRMYFLQYETFLEFVKTMVSFFMVLRTLREQGMISS